MTFGAENVFFKKISHTGALKTASLQNIWPPYLSNNESEISEMPY